MAKPRTKRKKILFVLEIIVFCCLSAGCMYMDRFNSRLDKIEQPELNKSKNSYQCRTAPQMTGYTTYALFGIDQSDKNTALARTVIQLLLQV